MLALMEMGVDYLGWDVRPEDGTALLLSRRIVAAAKEQGARTTLLVHSRKPDVLRLVAEMVQPDFLLLSSERDDSAMPPLAKALGSQTKLMMSVPVPVAGASLSVDSKIQAVEYAAYAGALTVDTCLDASQPARFGCTGQTNDWQVCASIVRAVSIPVVLAGGLTPENVSAGIAAVRPDIVDACTSLELSDRSKDLARCHAFVTAARSVN